METQQIMALYAKYYTHIQNLGSYPLPETPTIEEMELNRGAIRSCYKEIKETDFDGTLVDYLCFIATEFVLDSIDKTLTMKGLADNPDGLAMVINDEFEIRPKEMKCCIRLFFHNPKHFVENDIFKRIYEEIKEKNGIGLDDLLKKLFETMAHLRLKYYLSENKQLSKG